MKRTLFTLFLILSFFTAFAQQVTISPVPQNISWGEVAFPNDVCFYLVGADKADEDAVSMLSDKVRIVGSSEKINDNQYPDARPIIIGEFGDKTVSRYRDNIPAVSEGYYLEITC